MFHRIKSEAELAQEQETENQEMVETEETQDAVETEANTEPPSNNQEISQTKEASVMNQETPENTETQDEQAQANYAAPATPPYTTYGTPASFAQPAPESAPAQTHAPSAPKTSSEPRRLVIGAGITMSGEIEACDYLIVQGTVEAALKGASVLNVAETGSYFGTVEIDEATIAGRFEGDLTVNGRLKVTSTGSITGSITYKTLEVEAGAAIDGTMTPFTQIAPRAAAPSASKAKAGKTASSMAKAQAKAATSPAANSDEGELFQSVNVTAAE